MKKPGSSRSLLYVISFLSVACPLLYAQPAHAQIYESIGTRAQGMGGAFVAVADDATATWWNPAGLATGAYFSAALERGSLDDPGNPPDAGPARRDTSSGFALTVPSLGLSYYHLRVGEVKPASIASATPDRNVDEAASVDLRAISLHRFGVTIGQSMGQHLVIASTLGLLRGGVGSGNEAPSSDAVGHATELDVHSETHGDIDVGAMVSAGSARLGVNVKHVTAPSFGTGDSEVELTRQVRAGVAVVGHGAVAPLTLAADVDLTKTPTVNGDVQHVAAGAEIWLSKRRLGLRGGVSANLVGDARMSTSSGVSVALKTGLYVDGAGTFGSDTTRSGWGLSFRATF